MTIQDVHEKVRKLIALAKGSTNEHEAALAFARAQALLDRFNIEEAILDAPASEHENEDIESQTWETHDGRAQVRWRTILVHQLAKANGCHSFSIGGTNKVIASGKPSKLQTLNYLYLACAAEIERLARRNARGRGTAYANAYRHGCVGAIVDALKAEHEETVRTFKSQATTAFALIKVESAIAKIDDLARAARDFARARHNLRSYRANIRDASGYAAGKRDGTGIYGSGSRPALGAGAGRINQ